MAAPVRVLDDHEATSWRHDAHRLEAAEIDGGVLRLTVAYTGGCEAHQFAVLAREIRVRSNRLEAELSVAHDARGDSCKALIRKRLEFSLEPLLSPSGVGREQPLTLGLRLDGRRLPYRPADAQAPPDGSAAE